jgi:site-specific DNA-cytosine methylase
MKILVACEFSNAVAGAFREYGHNVVSCDLIENEVTGRQYHHTGDVREILNNSWDMMLAFPPCTHLAISGARWFKDKAKQQAEALDFVKTLLDAPIKYICLENPVGIIGTRIRKASQYIQPYEFGEPAFKKTGLWLKNLPKLKPTNILTIPEPGTAEFKAWNSIHLMPDRKSRAQDRSRTFKGIADAMAAQWNNLN